jgi:hypothetical protein
VQAGQRPPPPLETRVKPARPPAAPARQRPLADNPPRLAPESENASPGYEVIDEPEPIDLEPVPAGEDLDDADDVQPGRKRRRRRKKKRRTEGGRMDQLIPGVSNYLLGNAAAALLGLLLAGLSLVIPDVVLALIGYGALLTLVGLIWLYMRGVEDGMEMPYRPDDYSLPRVFYGVFLLLFGVLALVVFLAVAAVYAIGNPDRAWPPVLLTFLGLLSVAVGIFLVSSGYVSLAG